MNTDQTQPTPGEEIRVQEESAHIEFRGPKIGDLAIGAVIIGGAIEALKPGNDFITRAKGGLVAFGAFVVGNTISR